MRKALFALGIVALAVVMVIGLTQAGGDKEDDVAKLTLPAMQAKLKGAPPPLDAVYAKGNQLVGGGKDAFQAQRAELKGKPTVVNVWASWCGPCRYEFPIFQHAATKYGKQAAFLGIDTRDHDVPAKEFLASTPLPYPSFTDPNVKIASSLGVGQTVPSTLFFDAKGSKYVHQGVYHRQADLEADIRKYALGTDS